MTERFKKAYDSLVRAFFEGTLAKGTCVACACGNIIFDAIGESVTPNDLENEILNLHNFPLTKKDQNAYLLWGYKRYFGGDKWEAFIECRNEINKAGYTTEEFAAIETAFENATSISFGKYPLRDEQEILEDQYKGLCAVVDVLLRLDGENGSGEELKQNFRKHPKLLVC